MICGAAYLLGGFEGVEGHVVGEIADGVEAELEAVGGAVGGHLVELVLIVAREAHVTGLVGVGVVHGCGARTEGAVHERLEHGEMEERVVGGVAGATLVEDREREVEVDPLGDAKGEFAGVLEFFEDEPVVPGGVVLDGGDAVGESILDREFEGFAACFGGGRRDLLLKEGEGGSFADDACGVTVAVVVDLAAHGIWCADVDVGDSECGAVGDRDVAVGALEKCGMVSGNGVEILACGEGPGGPFGLVPTAADDPCAGREGRCVGTNLGEHRGERGYVVEIDGKALLAGKGDVGVRVVEAGHGEGAVEVDAGGVGVFEREDLLIGAGGDDRAGSDGDSGYAGGSCGRVAGFEARAGEDVAVEEDGVRRLCRGAANADESDGEEAARDAATKVWMHAMSVSSGPGSMLCRCGGGEAAGVEQEQEDAAEGKLTSGGVVGLLQGVNA